MSKQTNKYPNKTKSTQDIWRPFCVDQLLLGMGPAMECGWYSSWHRLGKPDFPFLASINCKYLLAIRGGTLCPLPPSVLGCPLVWTCIAYIMLSALLGLEDAVSLESLTTSQSPPLNRSLSFEGSLCSSESLLCRKKQLLWWGLNAAGLDG